MVGIPGIGPGLHPPHGRVLPLYDIPKNHFTPFSNFALVIICVIIQPKVMNADSKKPLISVVIPAYNEELFIGECIDSLKAQNFKGSYEIIVVDNNSSDQTAQIAQQRGVKVVFEQKQGVCHARHAGTEIAQGQIIVSTDADTLFADDWLNKIYQQFIEDPEVVAVAGEYSFINAPRWARAYTKLAFAIVHKIFLWKGKVIYVGASNLAFKKNIWPGYNTALTQGGDELDALIRLQNKGKVVFLKNNAVHTSNRRLSKGFFYNLLVTFLGYYLLDYFVGKTVGKSVLGSYPAIRTKDYQPQNFRLSLAKPAALFLIFSIFITYSVTSIHKSQAAMRLVKYAGSKFASIEDRTEVAWHR